MASVKIIITVLAVLLLRHGTLPFASASVDFGASLLPRKTVDERPNFSFDQLWALHNQFYTAFMFPNNVAQAKAINSTLLAPNIVGRVDATRVFPGQELNTECTYSTSVANLFGLFTGQTLNAKALTLLGVPIDYEVVHFAASKYVVSSATVVSFNFSTIVLPVEVDAWIAFDSNKQISEYDVTFRWFEQIIDLLIGNVQLAINATSVEQTVEYYSTALATSICNTEVTYCNGTDQQYSNFSSCYDFLTQDIRFGKAYELGANTLLCRTLHQYMVPSRPDVHCPHIGPSGGGMCVDDLTYAQKVLQPVFTNAPFVPNGKQNQNASIAAI